MRQILLPLDRTSKRIAFELVDLLNSTQHISSASSLLRLVVATTSNLPIDIRGALARMLLCLIYRGAQSDELLRNSFL